MKTDADVLRIVRRGILNQLQEIEFQLGIRPTTAQILEWHRKRTEGGWYSEQPDETQRETPAK